MIMKVKFKCISLVSNSASTMTHSGGRILARYEAPSDEFLFSEDPLKPGRLRTLALSESRKYHVREMEVGPLTS